MNNQHPSRDEEYQARLTAYALDQLDERERAITEAELSRSPEDQQFVEQTRRAAGLLKNSNQAVAPSATLRGAVEEHLQKKEREAMPTINKPQPERSLRPLLALAVAVCLFVLLGPLAFSFLWPTDQGIVSYSSGDWLTSSDAESASTEPASEEQEELHTAPAYPVGDLVTSIPPSESNEKPDAVSADFDSLQELLDEPPSANYSGRVAGRSMSRDKKFDGGRSNQPASNAQADEFGNRASGRPLTAAPAYTKDAEKNVPASDAPATTPLLEGSRGLSLNPGKSLEEELGKFDAPAATPQLKETRGLSNAASGLKVKNGKIVRPNISTGQAGETQFESLLPEEKDLNKKLSRQLAAEAATMGQASAFRDELATVESSSIPYDDIAPSNEQYAPIIENTFQAVQTQPLSTFSIDVDTASYANVRRFLTQNQHPPAAAVRIEELINYFHYDYPAPRGEHPFSVNLEMADCPWQPGHRLLRVGLKGKEIDRSERGASNIVFLLDVSGSMRDADKLPLVKQGMKMLVEQMGEDDRVAIVTYAGNAGLVLPSTSGDKKDIIRRAIDNMAAGGSTNGGAGIQLAYDVAVQHFVEGGANRVILATDGDLNVGLTSDNDLVQLIEEKAASGVFLTVLGFGTGNLKDAKMEKIADKGNGIYAYIDSTREAYKVLVEQMTGSLVTIAKDVKIQIEFNPREISSYRLIGYENRALAAEDFADDKKDAGEIGAGHTVTALFELVPVGAGNAAVPAGLKYQKPPEPAPKSELTAAAESGELLTVKLRYKQPAGQVSQLLEKTLQDNDASFSAASQDFRFATSVAAFGMLLRGSKYAGSASWSAVESYAMNAIGEDAGGYRREFLDLIRKARNLSK